MLRFGQEWVQQSPRQVLQLHSVLSLGVDAFGATVNGSDDIPSGKFLA